MLGILYSKRSNLYYLHMLPLTRPLILASNSPRRQQLLSDLGYNFEVMVRPTGEHFPDSLPVLEVAEYLAHQKAREFVQDCTNELVLCADTVVVVDQTVLNKPADRNEARAMLQLLSGRSHQVVTGICLLTSPESLVSRSDTAIVQFRKLNDWEIDYYIDQFKPYDKAGAYGIQEWIGMAAIERIDGSFYTIMGLPVHKVYELLTPYHTGPTF